MTYNVSSGTLSLYTTTTWFPVQTYVYSASFTNTRMVRYIDKLLYSVFVLLVITKAFVVLTYVHVIVVGRPYVFVYCTYTSVLCACV